MSLSISKRTHDSFIEPNGTSSMSPPAKRSRPEAPAPKLWDMISRLPVETTQAILYNICASNSVAVRSITAAHHERLAQVAARPPRDFASYSHTCWYALHRQHLGASNSKQYVVLEIAETLEEARLEILAQAGPEERYETRRNALEALRKITKSVMLCKEGVLRSELIGSMGELTAWADAMTEIAGAMSWEDMEKYKEEGLYEKLVHLQKMLRDPETEMPGLGDLYDLFEGVGDEGEHDEEKGGEGAEEEQEEKDGYKIKEDEDSAIKEQEQGDEGEKIK